MRRNSKDDDSGGLIHVENLFFLESVIHDLRESERTGKISADVIRTLAKSRLYKLITMNGAYHFTAQDKQTIRQSIDDAIEDVIIALDSAGLVYDKKILPSPPYDDSPNTAA